MKITYILDFLRTIQAGTEGQLAHLLRALPSRGHRVELVSFQDSSYLASCAESDFPEVSFRSFRGTSDLSRSAPVFFALYRHLRRSRPDVVHAFFPAASSIGLLVARLAGTKAIVSSRRDMGYHLKAKDRFLLRLANRTVSRIVVNAQAIRERTITIEGMDPARVTVIYNGIVTVKQAHQLRAEMHKDPIVGIVANLNREIKRVDVFLRAAAVVLQEAPEATFWVIGDGHLRPDLEELATALGIARRVTFLGRRTDVADLLPRFSVGVISSDSEGLSNAIMEYMAHGLPVVATAVGGNPELIQPGRNGFLVPPAEPRAMGQAILRILENPTLARHMGEMGKRRIAKEFGIGRMIEETCAVYDSILASRGQLTKRADVA